MKSLKCKGKSKILRPLSLSLSFPVCPPPLGLIHTASTLVSVCLCLLSLCLSVRLFKIDTDFLHPCPTRNNRLPAMSVEFYAQCTQQQQKPISYQHIGSMARSRSQCKDVASKHKRKCRPVQETAGRCVRATTATTTSSADHRCHFHHFCTCCWYRIPAQPPPPLQC